MEPHAPTVAHVIIIDKLIAGCVLYTYSNRKKKIKFVTCVLVVKYISPYLLVNFKST